MRWPKTASIFTIALILDLPIIPASAAESTLIQLRDSDQRVASIGFRLFTRNTALCPDLNPATGLILHALDQYPGINKDQAATIWAFPTAVSIEGIVPGSPADAAGLRAGDGLVTIAGFAVPALRPPGSSPTALRDAVEQYLQDMPSADPIPIRIKRGDQTLSVILIPHPACRTRVEVVAGKAIKARSDGAIIQIGQEFAGQLTEGELAFVLAHELAHTIDRHRLGLVQNKNREHCTGKCGSPALARQFEDEADLLALDLMLNAGWDPAIAPRFMRAKGKKFEPFFRINGSHRSASERAARMERALAEKRRNQRNRHELMW